MASNGRPDNQIGHAPGGIQTRGSKPSGNRPENIAQRLGPILGVPRTLPKPKPETFAPRTGGKGKLNILGSGHRIW